MATYAIGDIQGCYDDLMILLDRIQYDEKQDQLWFAGDLINRGPKSLDTLRWLKEHQVITVLGNHDLHLIAAHFGFNRNHHKDTFDDILQAADRDALIEWLRQKPLMHSDQGFHMLHAGLVPQWTIEKAQALAREAEAVIQSEQLPDFLAVMYGNEPTQWQDDLTGMDRIRFIVNTFTRIRICDAEGRQDLTFKGTTDTIPEPFMPWFKVPNRQTQNDKIIMGHWAALECNAHTANIFALDSGCVWGNHLTAMRLADQQYFKS